MKQNLAYQIKKDIEEVTSFFANLDFWIREDMGYVYIRIDKHPDFFQKRTLVEKVSSLSLGSSYGGALVSRIDGIVFGVPRKMDRDKEIHLGLSFSPQILHYYEKGSQNNYRSVVWIKCNFSTEKKEHLEVMVKYLKGEVFPNLPWKPFYDEDAYRNNFCRPKQEGLDWWNSAFYINPDYPKGYWRNHTLC